MTDWVVAGRKWMRGSGEEDKRWEVAKKRVAYHGAWKVSFPWFWLPLPELPVWSPGRWATALWEISFHHRIDLMAAEKTRSYSYIAKQSRRQSRVGRAGRAKQSRRQSRRQIRAEQEAEQSRAGRLEQSSRQSRTEQTDKHSRRQSRAEQEAEQSRAGGWLEQSGRLEQSSRQTRAKQQADQSRTDCEDRVDRLWKGQGGQTLKGTEWTAVKGTEWTNYERDRVDCERDRVDRLWKGQSGQTMKGTEWTVKETEWTADCERDRVDSRLWKGQSGQQTVKGTEWTADCERDRVDSRLCFCCLIRLCILQVMACPRDFHYHFCVADWRALRPGSYPSSIEQKKKRVDSRLWKGQQTVKGQSGQQTVKGTEWTADCERDRVDSRLWKGTEWTADSEKGQSGQQTVKRDRVDSRSCLQLSKYRSKVSILSSLAFISGFASEKIIFFSLTMRKPQRGWVCCLADIFFAIYSLKVLFLSGILQIWRHVLAPVEALNWRTPSPFLFVFSIDRPFHLSLLICQGQVFEL